MNATSPPNSPNSLGSNSEHNNVVTMSKSKQRRLSLPLFGQGRDTQQQQQQQQQQQMSSSERSHPSRRSVLLGQSKRGSLRSWIGGKEMKDSSERSASSNHSAATNESSQSKRGSSLKKMLQKAKAQRQHDKRESQRQERRAKFMKDEDLELSSRAKEEQVHKDKQQRRSSNKKSDSSVSSKTSRSSWTTSKKKPPKAPKTTTNNKGATTTDFHYTPTKKMQRTSLQAKLEGTRWGGSKRRNGDNASVGSARSLPINIIGKNSKLSTSGRARGGRPKLQAVTTTGQEMNPHYTVPTKSSSQRSLLEAKLERGSKKARKAAWKSSSASVGSARSLPVISKTKRFLSSSRSVDGRSLDGSSHESPTLPRSPKATQQGLPHYALPTWSSLGKQKEALPRSPSRRNVVHQQQHHHEPVILEATTEDEEDDDNDSSQAKDKEEDRRSTSSSAEQQKSGAAQFDLWMQLIDNLEEKSEKEEEDDPVAEEKETTPVGDLAPVEEQETTADSDDDMPSDHEEREMAADSDDDASSDEEETTSKEEVAADSNSGGSQFDLWMQAVQQFEETQPQSADPIDSDDDDVGSEDGNDYDSEAGVQSDADDSEEDDEAGSDGGESEQGSSASGVSQFDMWMQAIQQLEDGTKEEKKSSDDEPIVEEECAAQGGFHQSEQEEEGEAFVKISDVFIPRVLSNDKPKKPKRKPGFLNSFLDNDLKKTKKKKKKKLDLPEVPDDESEANSEDSQCNTVDWDDLGFDSDEDSAEQTESNSEDQNSDDDSDATPVKANTSLPAQPRPKIKQPKPAKKKRFLKSIKEKKPPKPKSSDGSESDDSEGAVGGTSGNGFGGERMGIDDNSSHSTPDLPPLTRKYDLSIPLGLGPANDESEEEMYDESEEEYEESESGDYEEEEESEDAEGEDEEMPLSGTDQAQLEDEDKVMALSDADEAKVKESLVERFAVNLQQVVLLQAWWRKTVARRNYLDLSHTTHILPDWMRGYMLAKIQGPTIWGSWTRAHLNQDMIPAEEIPNESSANDDPQTGPDAILAQWESLCAGLQEGCLDAELMDIRRILE